jgi:Flp pilus assembly pilin Flp
MADVLMRPFVTLQVAVHALREREDGQTKTEYAFLFACLVLAIIVALYFLRSPRHGLFSDAPSSVSNAPGP